MADAAVVLCDVLCFLANKFGKMTLKTLKSALVDFYTSEDLASAKSQLLKDIDNLNLSVNRPYISSRREGDGRLEREVSDVIQLLTFLDENKALDRLPTYASANPDNMPSLRMYDGDLSVIMRKLSDMDARMNDLALAVAAMFHGAENSQVRSGPAASTSFEARRAINDKDTVRQPSAVGTVGNSGKSETHAPVIPDWAAIASTPCENRFGALSTIDDEAGACDGAFTVVNRGRRSKRAGQQSSPAAGQRQQQQSQQQQQRQQQQPQQPQQQQKSLKRPLFGKAANARASIVGSTVISAAKKFRKKAVFSIDNVSISCNDSDLCRFVSDLNIEVVSCFEVKPRRRRDEEDIVRNEDGTFAADRKAFRLCVYDDDRDRVMDAAVWPDSVMVSEWFFKARGDDVNRRQQASDRVNDKQPVRLTAASPTRTAHQAAASSASSIVLLLAVVMWLQLMTTQAVCKLPVVCLLLQFLEMIMMILLL